MFKFILNHIFQNSLENISGVKIFPLYIFLNNKKEKQEMFLKNINKYYKKNREIHIWFLYETSPTEAGVGITGETNIVSFWLN